MGRLKPLECNHVSGVLAEFAIDVGVNGGKRNTDTAFRQETTALDRATDAPRSPDRFTKARKALLEFLGDDDRRHGVKGPSSSVADETTCRRRAATGLSSG